MRLLTRAFPAMFIAALSLEVHAQNLSFGVVGGGSLTDSFPTQTFPGGPVELRFYSQSKDYIVGPMLEYRFTPRWSGEVDGLFRTLHMTFAAVESNGSLNSVSPSPVITWEFPILAKYRFSAWKVRPLVELGPSFRTAGNLNGTNPSHAGATAGIGAEVHAGKLAIAPVLRYTRWEADRVFLGQPKSNPNQVELLVGFSTATTSDSHPLGSHLFGGAIVGTALTDDYRTQNFAALSGTQSFSETTTPRRGVIAGAMAGVKLPRHFLVEVDALYHPLRFETLITFNGVKGTPDDTSTTTWEFPILAKYTFSTRFLKPFAEVGPSFRLPAGGDLSYRGVTAGAGVELRAGLIKFGPEVRFTHWTADNPPASSGTLPNQVELLVGIYF